MNKNKTLTLCRIGLVVVALGLIAIPVAVVNHTGNGFSPLVAGLFVSGSILCLMGAVLSSNDWHTKKRIWIRAGLCIALLIALINLWL